MARAKRREDWAHTSALLALIYNANRDPKRTEPAKPQDFDPTREPEQVEEVSDMAGLEAFCKGGL